MWFHRHKWKAIAAKVWHVETDVLYTCHCGKFKTEFMAGRWTMSDLQPTEAIEREIQEALKA